MPEKENNLNVLVSEDDPDDQYLFESALLEAGVKTNVSFVLTGDQLIQHLLRTVLSNSESSKTLPDLIIADLKRPFFWFDALRELRIYSQFNHIPIFLFSMRPDQELKTNALRQGATAVYEKPATFHELRNIVRDIARSLRGK